MKHIKLKSGKTIIKIRGTCKPPKIFKDHKKYNRKIKPTE